MVISLVGKPTGRLVFSNWREEFESANAIVWVYLVHFGHTNDDILATQTMIISETNLNFM